MPGVPFPTDVVPVIPFSTAAGAGAGSASTATRPPPAPTSRAQVSSVQSVRLSTPTVAGGLQSASFSPSLTSSPSSKRGMRSVRPFPRLPPAAASTTARPSREADVRAPSVHSTTVRSSAGWAAEAGDGASSLESAVFDDAASARRRHGRRSSRLCAPSAASPAVTVVPAADADLDAAAFVSVDTVRDSDSRGSRCTVR